VSVPNSQAPAHWSKDFVEHLRTVHFALLAISAGLILLVLSSKEYNAINALVELQEIINLKQQWSPKWVLKQAQYSGSIDIGISPLGSKALPPPPAPIPTTPLVDRTAWGFLSSQQTISTNWNTHPEQAAAGLWTTPSDMAKLLVEISAAYNGGGAVLTQASALAMLTPVLGSQYGLGGAVRNPGANNLLFMKNGENLGYTSWFVLYPYQGNGIVIMTNLDSGSSPANWMNLFNTAVSVAVTSLSWPAFPGLSDFG
jgi:beta-lactamase family protein